MIRRPPRSTLFPTRRSSDLRTADRVRRAEALLTEGTDLLQSGDPDSALLKLVDANAVLPGDRSEEHTSELQSLAYLVCRLLLEKKKQPNKSHTHLLRTAAVY